jgi:hypothetical protein
VPWADIGHHRLVTHDRRVQPPSLIGSAVRSPDPRLIPTNVGAIDFHVTRKVRRVRCILIVINFGVRRSRTVEQTRRI